MPTFDAAPILSATTVALVTTELASKAELTRGKSAPWPVNNGSRDSPALDLLQILAKNQGQTVTSERGAFSCNITRIFQVTFG